jgi:hypothetical protein
MAGHTVIAEISGNSTSATLRGTIHTNGDTIK